MKTTEIEEFCPADKQAWREWLATHHINKESVWLIMHRKSAASHNISWSDAVDEALCFGWIDSTKKSIDSEKSMQYFSKRKPKSTWSRVNKIKIDALIAANLMTPAGLKCVEVAKENGSWTILDSVEDLIIPDDLHKALAALPKALDYFQSLNKSNKKAFLHGLALTKQQATRDKRIAKIIETISTKL